MGYFIAGTLVAAAALLPIAIWRQRRAAARARHNEERAAEQGRQVGLLAGGLVHEIKNPLNSINLNLQLLEEDLGRGNPDDNGRMTKRIVAVRKEAQRMADILDGFLRYVRADKLDSSECLVNELVEEVLTFVGPELRMNNINLLKSLGDVPPCRADPKLLKQALLNLLINAEQAMPRGGDLMVRTGVAQDTIAIEVTDTGSGIPAEKLPEVFDAYFSTKKGGTGLGLPTVKRIVEEHGGEVTVESEPGKGSSFRIALPVGAPQPT